MWHKSVQHQQTRIDSTLKQYILQYSSQSQVVISSCRSFWNNEYPSPPFQPSRINEKHLRNRSQRYHSMGKATHNKQQKYKPVTPHRKRGAGNPSSEVTLGMMSTILRQSLKGSAWRIERRILLGKSLTKIWPRNCPPCGQHFNEQPSQ